MAGANEAGYHLANVNYGRDFTATMVADITSVGAGDACENCGAPLRLERGVEVGNIFKLGTRYTDAWAALSPTRTANLQPVMMGSYGIGVGRLLACVAEEHHDEKGLIWPVSIAPFPVHLVVLPGKTNGYSPRGRSSLNRISFRQGWNRWSMTAKNPPGSSSMMPT